MWLNQYYNTKEPPVPLNTWKWEIPAFQNQVMLDGGTVESLLPEKTYYLSQEGYS